MKALESHRYMFEVLKKADPKLRKAILQNSDESLVCVLAEIIFNIMGGQVPLSKQQKQKLKPYKKLFRKIVNQCSRPQPNKKLLKRQVVQSGGALPFLIPLILPLIAKAALAGAVSTGVGVGVKKLLDK